MPLRQRKPLLILIFCLCFYFAECRDLFGQYWFDSWTTDSGLPQNGVRAITQTPDGYLWFTTFDGLVRFDGVKFTTFSKGSTKGIAGSRFTELYCDKSGTLYATTIEDGTLTIYRNGIFRSFASNEIPGHYIELVRPDEKGEIRFLAVEGEQHIRNWYYLRDGKFVFSEPLDKNGKIKEYDGKSGKHWTVTPDETIEVNESVTTTYQYSVRGLDAQTEVLEDSGGALWIGGFDLARLQNGKVETFGEKDGFPKDSDFHSFWEDKDGSVWFANGGRSGEGRGLVSYKDGHFSSYGTEAGLSNPKIFNVFKDREGVVWVATNKGLNRLRRKIIQAYDAKNGLNGSEVYPIYRDSKDNIWVGTANGLTMYHDGKFEIVKLRQDDPTAPEPLQWKNTQTSVQSLWEDSNGKMWIGIDGGLFIAENGGAHMLRETEGHHVFAIRQDKNGNIWAATSKGILLYRDYKLKAFYSTKDGLPGEVMDLIYEDSKGRLWFGGYGGLSEFKDGKFINYTTREGLTGNYVRSIYEDNEGTLWIGTYGEGLSRFKDGRFTNYKTENGLYNNDVFAIEEDSQGIFWISTNRGIYRVKRQELNDFADGKIEKVHSIGYGKEDGMLNNECNGGRQPASIKDKDGKIWFPTQDGVVVVDAENEKYNTLSPSVLIESATVEKENADISQGLSVDPGQKNIEINFTGISLIKSDQIKFKYKLEGHDPDWIDAGMRRTAYYSYVPPGNYKFRVKAVNSDGIWNETGATLEVELKPYFYQTNTFTFLCLSIGALGLLIVWKISVHQLESRERRLAKLVADKTKELKKANEELLHLANSDGLTKVGNRRLFEEFLGKEWSRADRFNTEISLILIDIDHFKLYNDNYGHQAGDACLKKVAAALKKTTHRPTDLVARFGGEEFAIILGATDSTGAVNIAERAMANIKELNIPHCKSKTSESVTISIGVATTFAGFGMTETELIKAADEALYRAKENGRNQLNSYIFPRPIPPEPPVLEEFINVN